MRCISPCGAPTAQGSPLPLPHPGWGNRTASAREGMAFGARDKGPTVPSPALSKAHTTTSRTPPPPRSPHSLLHNWRFSLLGHEHSPCPHRGAGCSPFKGRCCLALSASLQCPLDLGLLPRSTGNGS